MEYVVLRCKKYEQTQRNVKEIHKKSQYECVEVAKSAFFLFFFNKIMFLQKKKEVLKNQ